MNDSYDTDGDGDTSAQNGTRRKRAILTPDQVSSTHTALLSPHQTYRPLAISSSYLSKILKATWLGVMQRTAGPFDYLRSHTTRSEATRHPSGPWRR